jgi:hypothetical protein
VTAFTSYRAGNQAELAGRHPWRRPPDDLAHLDLKQGGSSDMDRAINTLVLYGTLAAAIGTVPLALLYRRITVFVFQEMVLVEKDRVPHTHPKSLEEREREAEALMEAHP